MTDLQFVTGEGSGGAELSVHRPREVRDCGYDGSGGIVKCMWCIGMLPRKNGETSIFGQDPKRDTLRGHFEISLVIEISHKNQFEISHLAVSVPFRKLAW